jgi:adenylate kinase
VTIVVIEAPPVEVLGRRTKDAKRRRDKELLAEIEEHQQLNRAIAMAYAAFTGAAVRIIVNKDGKLSDAVREMAETLR